MIPWLPFERRWRDRLVLAMLPFDQHPGAHALPSPAALALDRVWLRFQQTAPPLLRVGFRLAIWALTLFPVLLIGRLRTFRGLSSDDRDRLLEVASNHRRFLVRQMVLALQLIACWAYFTEPAPRRALAGDGVDDLAGDPEFLAHAARLADAAEPSTSADGGP